MQRSSISNMALFCIGMPMLFAYVLCSEFIEQ